MFDDWLDLAASIFTYIGFLAALGLFWCLDHLTSQQQRRVLYILLYWFFVAFWVLAVMDTTMLHLMSKDWWPEWSYWRRVIWRPLQAVIFVYCYLNVVICPWLHRKKGSSDAQKSGQFQHKHRV